MKERLKVLHIIHTLERGGAEKLLCSTVRSGNSTTEFIVCSLYGNDELLDMLVSQGIEVHVFNRKHKFDPTVIGSLYRLIKSLRPDIVHTHLFFATVYGRLAARLSKVPVVTTEHNQSNWEDRACLPKAAYRISGWYCSKIFAISDAVKTSLVDRVGVAKRKVAVIRNCIDLSQSPKPRWRDLDPDPDRELVVGSVGRLDSRKGYDILLRAVAKLDHSGRRVRCILVGDGKERGRLADLAKELGIEHRVTFAGGQTEIGSFVDRMDIFVLPSRTEGFGIAILEAMAQGCPVIASNVGGIPEIIEHGVNGLLVPPEDVEKLCEAVQKLTEPGLATRLAVQAHEKVTRDHSMEKYVKRLEAEYRSVLAPKSVPETLQGGASGS